MTSSEPIALNQLELREITRSMAEAKIPLEQLSSTEWNNGLADLADGREPRLKHFLEHAEAVYKESADTLANNRISDRTLAEEIKEGVLQKNHCFGLFRPGFTRPEIVVYTSLQNTKTMEGDQFHPERLPGDIQAMRNNTNPFVNQPDTMAFYSISTAPLDPSTKGLANELIGRIANAISGQRTEAAAPKIESIKTFSTLSPVPGFNRWLANLYHQSFTTPDLLTADEKNIIGKCFTLQLDTVRGERVAHLARNLSNADEQKQAPEVIKRLCLRYLLSMDTGKDPRARDADPASIVAPPLHMVPGMHVKGNGAFLAEIHPMVDPSDLSIGDLGTKVNYVYDLGKLCENKAFCRKYHIPVSEHLERIAEGWQIPLNQVTAPKHMAALKEAVNVALIPNSPC